jgi:hypothetical protein
MLDTSRNTYWRPNAIISTAVNQTYLQHSGPFYYGVKVAMPCMSWLVHPLRVTGFLDIVHRAICFHLQVRGGDTYSVGSLRKG